MSEVGASGDDKSRVKLARLRPELSIIRGASSRDTGRGWIIYDPVQHRHFQIDQDAYDILSVWSQCTYVDELMACAGARFETELDDDQVLKFQRFLEVNCLVTEPREGGWRAFHQASERKSKEVGLFTRLAHNYLFFRIPLFKPHGFLSATLPLVEPIYSRAFAYLVIALGMIGLYLSSRQWDAFLKTTDYLFSWQGLLHFGAALVFIKVVHEFAHAYTAVRHGCFVPTMGVAVMLLTPLLYTDVTDAWKLRDRRKRLSIDAAGIVAELGVACIATFLWAFLPDGPMRSAAFMLATAGWLMSLAINLNPFMRFDGYYLFSELVGIENLQSRAFALSRWRLREILFGLGQRCPELLPARIVNTMILWGWATWIYRLLLFIGIALFVYAYCFKVLGVILFVLEIVFLIAKPIWAELSEWYAMRNRIVKSKRWITSAGIAACLLAIAIVPWSQAVMVPAILQLSSTQDVHAPRPAFVADVHVAVGQNVVAGQALFTLHSKEIANKLDKADTELRLVRLRLGRGNVDMLDREQRLVLKRRLLALEAKRLGLLQERSELVLRAQISGRVLEIDQAVHKGRWIQPADRLALIGDVTKFEVKGFVDEDDVWRLANGADGRFVPDTPLARAIDVKLREIAVGGISELNVPSLASVNGGPIAVERDQDGRLVPTKGQYRMRLDLMSAPAFDGSIDRGVIHLNGTPESLFAKFWRRTLNVLVRESGA